MTTPAPDGLVAAFRAALRMGCSPRRLPWFRYRGDAPEARMFRALLGFRYARFASSPQRRLVANAAAAAWPLTSFAFALRNLSRYGRHVAKEHGHPRWRQLLEQVVIANTYDVQPAKYYAFRLFLPENRGRARFVVTPTAIGSLLRGLNRDLDWTPVDHKVAFFEHCLGEGLPTAPLIATFREGEHERWFEGEPGSLPPRNVVFKPSNRSGGRGFERWDHDDASATWSHGGRKLGAAALVALARERSRADGCLLQHAVVNHPAVAAFARDAVCTVRLVSYRRPGGPPQVLFANLRMPAGDAQVDNTALGGLYSCIDPENGVLIDAIGLSILQGVQERHPYTGARIRGFRIPGWEDVVALCLRAHRSFPDFASLGWDVAVTPDGPVLLEANTIWGIPEDVFVGDTPFPACVLEWLDRPAAAPHNPMP